MLMVLINCIYWQWRVIWPELYVTDGTASGTVMVKDFSYGSSSGLLIMLVSIMMIIVLV